MTELTATYGQLDKVLRSLDFSCRLERLDAPARVYEHKESGATIILPPFPDGDPVLPFHMFMVRTTLDGFGVTNPTDFASKLQQTA